MIKINLTIADIPAILWGETSDKLFIAVHGSMSKRYHCKLQVLKDGEHYFHTDGQLHYFRYWLRDNIL